MPPTRKPRTRASAKQAKKSAEPAPALEQPLPSAAQPGEEEESSSAVPTAWEVTSRFVRFCGVEDWSHFEDYLTSTMKRDSRVRAVWDHDDDCIIEFAQLADARHFLVEPPRWCKSVETCVRPTEPYWNEGIRSEVDFTLPAAFKVDGSGNKGAGFEWAGIRFQFGETGDDGAKDRSCHVSMRLDEPSVKFCTPEQMRRFGELINHMSVIMENVSRPEFDDKMREVARVAEEVSDKAWAAALARLAASKGLDLNHQGRQDHS